MPAVLRETAGGPWPAPASRPEGAVVVGLSGGVDSSVAALLLDRAGCRVSGLFMKNWEQDDDASYCAAREDLIEAVAAAECIGIDIDAVNFSRRYWTRVFDRFLAEYRAGRTPNPDIFCNTEVKFGAFLDHALAHGAEAIATGHYARVVHEAAGGRLFKAHDRVKDQTYFLHRLSAGQLARSHFPLGGLEKREVRRLAARAGLANHARRDSTGICFIGERRFRDFLVRYLPAGRGPIRDLDGRLLGEHPGALYFTPGQREGLGIGGRAGAPEQPWYVVGKDVARNTLYVAPGRDHPALWHRELLAADTHWIAGRPPPMPWQGTARIRHRQPEQPCRVELLAGGRCHVRFEQDQWAIAPGQSVVFYTGEECLGGAIIEQVPGGPLPPPAGQA